MAKLNKENKLKQYVRPGYYSSAGTLYDDVLEDLGMEYCHNEIEYNLAFPENANLSYPIVGYAPGDYTCRCITCSEPFIGDKRAVQCNPCAIKNYYGNQHQKKLSEQPIEEAAQEFSDEHHADKSHDEIWIMSAYHETTKNYWYNQFRKEFSTPA